MGSGRISCYSLIVEVVLQHSEAGGDDRFQYGVCAMQGWRTDMVRDVECWGLGRWWYLWCIGVGV